MNCKSVIYETGKKDQTKLNTQKSAGRRQKKKSRRTADILPCAYETAALKSEPPFLLRSHNL
jgi:hypothetical protein